MLIWVDFTAFRQRAQMYSLLRWQWMCESFWELVILLFSFKSDKQVSSGWYWFARSLARATQAAGPRLMSRRVRLNCTQNSYSPAIYFIFASVSALLSVFLSYCLRGPIIHVLLLANETHCELVNVGAVMMSL